MNVVKDVSTHSRPKAAGRVGYCWLAFVLTVSTHSRPKAAGRKNGSRAVHKSGFNSQPPEGGWHKEVQGCTQIPRVSTHSRPKAAGWLKKYEECVSKVSTHSRPKAAG